MYADSSYPGSAYVKPATGKPEGTVYLWRRAFDRFHLMMHVGKAADTVRKRDRELLAFSWLIAA
jgi:hypothetical protein